MYIISPNHKVPKEILDVIKPLNKNEDYSLAISQTPIHLLLVLESITMGEVQVMNGEMEIGACVLQGVPFITLIYKGMTFEFSILDMKSMDIEHNAINIISIDRTDYVVRNMRVIGVNVEIMKVIVGGVKAVDFSMEEAKRRVADIYTYSSTEDIHSNAKVKQIFLGV